METIRTWAFSLCAAMIAASMLRLLLPRGNMQKIYGLTISIFVLCVLLSPFLLHKPELRLEWQIAAGEDIAQRAARLTALVEDQSGQAAAAELEKIVSAQLAKMGINEHRITIHMNGTGQHDESAPTAEVLLVSPQQSSASIEAALEGALGFPVRVSLSS